MRISPVVIGFPVEICHFTVTKSKRNSVSKAENNPGDAQFFYVF